MAGAQGGQGGEGNRGVPGTAAGGAYPGANANANANGAAAGAGAGTAADEWESLIDSARGLGYDFGGGAQPTDDRAFLLDLLNRANANRQSDYFAQLGRALAPRYREIQGFLGQGQGQQPQQQGQGQRQTWEPPPFDQNWMRFVQHDPQSGAYLARPGADPRYADAVNEFDRWQTTFQQNPMAPVQEMIQARLPELINTQVAQAIQQYQTQQTTNAIVQRNSEWMYDHTPDGRVAIGVGGRPIPTQHGMRYGQIVNDLERSGMRDPTQIDQYARNLLVGELAQGQLRGGQQQQATQPQASNALAGSRPQANVLGSLTPQQRQQTPGATEPDNAGLSLHEVLRRELSQFSDSDFREQY